MVYICLPDRALFLSVLSAHASDVFVCFSAIRETQEEGYELQEYLVILTVPQIYRTIYSGNN